MEKNIGLIGVGTMGKMILERLMSAGYDVWASDPAPSAREFISQNGAELVDFPSKIATHASVIILSLPASQDIEEVIFGDQGLIESVTEGHIIIDTSTVDPQTTRNAANRLTQTNTRYLDAPILGRPFSIGNWVLPRDSGAEEQPVGPDYAEYVASGLFHHRGYTIAGGTSEVQHNIIAKQVLGL